MGSPESQKRVVDSIGRIFDEPRTREILERIVLGAMTDPDGTSAAADCRRLMESPPVRDAIDSAVRAILRDDHVKEFARTVVEVALTEGPLFSVVRDFVLRCLRVASGRGEAA